MSAHEIYLWSTFVTLWPLHADEYSLTLKEIPELPAGRYRVKRADTWRYDGRVVSALHTLNARQDIEIIDPTGLLGGSRYGEQAKTHKILPRTTRRVPR